MNRTEKNTEIELISSWLKSGELALCADYRGLNVAKVTDLRGKLLPVSAKGRVVKNTLAKISSGATFGEHSSADLDKFLKLFNGPSMLIMSFGDPVGCSKVVDEFAKTNEAFTIKGAMFEGSFVDLRGINDLASMPSKEELWAKLLRVIAAPATQLLRTINEPAGSLVRVLEAQRKKLEG